MLAQNNTPPITVLIAEDQETDAFFVEQAFGQSKVENNLFWVKDGQEVMAFLQRDASYVSAPRPDLILLDLEMPRQNGHDTLEAIKRDESLRDIPVIIISGSQDTKDVERAYQNHANAYIPKSNGFDDMLEFVEAIEKFWFLQARLPQKSA